MSDKAAGLKNTFLAVAIVVSMTTGGFLSDDYGFRVCSDIMALMAVVVFIANTLLVVGHKVFV